MNTQAAVCRDLIIQALDHYCLPMSEAAVRLLCMIAAHESDKLLYARQIRGPALSFYQIEPRSYNDVAQYAQRKGYMEGEFPSDPERLMFDFRFATGIARVFLLRIPEPIPAKEQLSALADYAKQYWNTKYGKATPAMYLSAYQELFNED